MHLRERSLPKEEKGEFPLVLWQNTEGHEEEYRTAEECLGQIKEQLETGGCVYTSLGCLRFDGDAHPEAWLDAGPPWFLKIKSADQALELAKKYGHRGWWRLDELSKWIEGEGMIVRVAMKEMGFRPHKRTSEKWVRLKRDEPYRLARREEDVFVPIEAEELRRLQKLMVLPNAKHGMGKELNLRIGERGFIFIHLVADPSAGTTTETLWQFDVQLHQRGHLAKEQHGFTLTARNVSLDGERAIYIKATSPEKSPVEIVWPTSTSRDGLFQLAFDLDGRLKAGLTSG